MKYVTITLMLVVLLATFIGGVGTGTLVGLKLSEQPVKPVYPTGTQVLGVLQDYRLSEKLPAFELSPILCDNIVERWQNYVKNDSHQGWEEFVAREYPPGFTASEMFVSSDLPTPIAAARDMVEKLKGSPSHNLAIHNFNKICVYSDKGSTVAILSN